MNVVTCSSCGKPRDVDRDFTPRSRTSCTKVNQAGERVVYRYQHPKRRSYACHDCEAARMRESRERKRGASIERPSMQGRQRCCNTKCDRWATWHSPEVGSWRACDLHRLPGDEPIRSPAFDGLRSRCRESAVPAERGQESGRTAVRVVTALVCVIVLVLALVVVDAATSTPRDRTTGTVVMQIGADHVIVRTAAGDITAGCFGAPRPGNVVQLEQRVGGFLGLPMGWQVVR